MATTKLFLVLLTGAVLGGGSVFFLTPTPPGELAVAISAEIHELGEGVSCVAAEDSDIDMFARMDTTPAAETAAASLANEAVQDESYAGSPPLSKARIEQDIRALGSESKSQVPAQTNLPHAYLPFLEPKRHATRRMTSDENYNFFASDDRDESWAYTMELAMQDYIASNQNTDGAIIEYVECRSRMCMVAGSVPDGSNDDFGEHLEAMQDTGWWQLSNTSHTAGGMTGGDYRFVTFVPRDSEFTLVPDNCH